MPAGRREELADAGTSIAVVVAYVLAGELARAADVRSGFEAYERVMRPIVTDARSIPKLMSRLMNPRARLGVRLLHGVLTVVRWPRVRSLVARFSGGERGGAALPVYGWSGCGGRPLFNKVVIDA